jgi:hypothetical protein
LRKTATQVKRDNKKKNIHQQSTKRLKKPTSTQANPTTNPSKRISLLNPL